MANTLNLGTDGNWATKEGSVLGYNSENNNYKPLPFEFERAGNATRVNKEGLIETVGSGEPRIDFKDDSKGALLLEPSRTNKISTSNDFNGSGWLKTDLISTANQIISPDGTLNASKLEITGNGSLRNQSQAFFDNGYAYSIFVKKGNSSYVTIRSAFFTQSISVGFDLDNLTAQTNGKIEDYGNDWYRLSITKDISGDADKSGFFYIYLPNSLGSQTSVSGNYTYFYGGQIEDGTYATSYIPTQGSAATRVADACNDAGNEQVINSTEGVLYADIKGFISQDTTEPNRYITITNGTSNERVALLLGGNPNQLRAIIYSSTQSINLSFTTSLTDVKQFNKLAVKYKSGDYAFFLNGAKIGGSTETSIFSENTLNDFSFDVGGGTQQFRGMVKDIKLYNTALTDQELIALTS